jgi:hypothetical protein
VPETFERSSLPCRTAPNDAKCDERQSGERSTHVSTLVSAVVLAERNQCARSEKGEDHQGRDNRKVIKAGLRHELHLLSELETDVLQGLGSVPIEARGQRIVAAPGGEIALRYPRGGPMTGR